MKRMWALMLTIVMVFTLCACGGKTAEAPIATAETAGSAAKKAVDETAPDTIVAKYAVTFPNTGTQAEGAEKLAELIEKHSEGRIDVEVYYSSQLGGNTEAMEGLRQGTIEITELALTAISAYSDIWSTFSLPYLWDSGKEAVETIGSNSVMEVLEADVEANGMMIIGWMNLGSRSILNTKRPIYTPDDMKGLTIRVIEDPILVDSIIAMGGSPVAMPWSDCYSGLEQGTIDGLENSTPVITGSAIQEVAKYFSLTEQFIMPDPVLISAAWFNSLSPENQEAVLAAGKEYTKVWNEEIWPASEEAALQVIIDAGVEVNEVDKTAFYDATESVRADFVKNGSKAQANLFEVLMAAKS